MPMNNEEAYQRRIDTMEWTAPAMTEDERLENRRFEAGFAFEMMHPAISRAQFTR